MFLTSLKLFAVLYALNSVNTCDCNHISKYSVSGNANFFFSLLNDLYFPETGISILVSFRFRSISGLRISGVPKSVTLIWLPFQTIVYYNVIYLNTPETAGVSHPVYWLFLYGLFMSHAHNPPPRVSDSRPPFQSPGSVRMFCIACRSVVGFFYQWTFVVSIVCKKIDCINRVAKSSPKYIKMWR